MVEIVQEFVVRQEYKAQFELTYGPGGAWSKLFASGAGFRGMTVLRDNTDSLRYLTIEVWDSEIQREQALAGQSAAYALLESSLEQWLDSKRTLGVYSVIGQAAVRPRSKTPPNKTEGRGRDRSW